MNTEKLIKEVISQVKNLLIEKNRAYGDSAINPSNVFSNGDALDSLGARIDDKLMRIKNVGINDETEDTLIDLIGYLVLYKVALKKESGSNTVYLFNEGANAHTITLMEVDVSWV